MSSILQPYNDEINHDGRVALRWSPNGFRSGFHLDRAAPEIRGVHPCFFMWLHQDQHTKVYGYAIGTSQHCLYCGQARNYYCGVKGQQVDVKVDKGDRMHAAITCVLVFLEMLISGIQPMTVDFIIYCPEPIQQILSVFKSPRSLNGPLRNQKYPFLDRFLGDQILGRIVLFTLKPASRHIEDFQVVWQWAEIAAMNDHAQRSLHVVNAAISGIAQESSRKLLAAVNQALTVAPELSVTSIWYASNKALFSSLAEAFDYGYRGPNDDEVDNRSLSRLSSTHYRDLVIPRPFYINQEHQDYFSEYPQHSLDWPNVCSGGNDRIWCGFECDL